MGFFVSVLFHLESIPYVCRTNRRYPVNLIEYCLLSKQEQIYKPNTMPAKKLNDLIQSTLTGKAIAELPVSLGLNGKKWLTRKVNNPGLFTGEELTKLAKVLGQSRTTLITEYGVGRDSLTVAEAHAIQEEESLNAPGQPADAHDGASARPEALNPAA
jgi:hypothetical protein